MSSLIISQAIMSLYSVSPHPATSYSASHHHVFPYPTLSLAITSLPFQLLAIMSLHILP
jgi:hypothetical protein